MVRSQGYVAVGEIRSEPTAEQALIQAGKVGDRAALEQLLALHRRPVVAFCQGMLGRADDAEDAAQETFLRALRALPRFRGEAGFRTWLFRIAINVCLQSRATHRSTEPLEEGRDSPLAVAASPEAIALGHLRLMEALCSLPPRLRALLLLKEWEGCSVAEIAAAVRWNPNRVKNELARARRLLVEWQRREQERSDARVEGDER
jgi:RNA polymerase sigma-70 factor (ECF subfamily)